MLRSNLELLCFKTHMSLTQAHSVTPHLKLLEVWRLTLDIGNEKLPNVRSPLLF